MIGGVAENSCSRCVYRAKAQRDTLLQLGDRIEVHRVVADDGFGSHALRLQSLVEICGPHGLALAGIENA